MKHLVIFLQLAIPFLLLHTGRSKTPATRLAQQTRVNISTSDSIQFIFQRDKDTAFPELVKIKAAIVNNSGVTLYFLSYTCDGMQDFILYDTSMLRRVRLLNCRASYPVKVGLKPFEKIEFTTHIKLLKKDAPFRLDYRLVLLKDNFNLDDMHYARPGGFSLLPFIVLKGNNDKGL